MEIILIRHGKPTGAINPKLSASGFARWVKNYNASSIDPNNPPPESLCQLLNQHLLVASNLTRAIDSAILCTGRKPDLQLKELREMDIPRHKIPFSFKAYTWLLINRILWLVGFNGKVESFNEAQMRARKSAEALSDLAKHHEKIAVFGHGMMNNYLAKELNKLGWVRSDKSRKYWGTIKLTG